MGRGGGGAGNGVCVCGGGVLLGGMGKFHVDSAKMQYSLVTAQVQNMQLDIHKGLVD